MLLNISTKFYDKFILKAKKIKVFLFNQLYHNELVFFQPYSVQYVLDLFIFFFLLPYICILLN